MTSDIKSKASSEKKVIELTQEFVETLKQRTLISSAQFTKQYDKATYPDMPDFHLLVAFDSEQHMNDCFNLVRNELLNSYPHSELMKRVTNFKVSFAELINSPY